MPRKWRVNLEFVFDVEGETNFDAEAEAMRLLEEAIEDDTAISFVYKSTEEL